MIEPKHVTVSTVIINGFEYRLQNDTSLMAHLEPMVRLIVEGWRFREQDWL